MTQLTDRKNTEERCEVSRQVLIAAELRSILHNLGMDPMGRPGSGPGSEGRQSLRGSRGLRILEGSVAKRSKSVNGGCVR